MFRNLAAPEEPNQSGKHFYADFRVGQHGIHYADLLGGELREDLDLWVSTSQYQLGIFTDECPHYNCNVKTRWDPHDSLTKRVVSSEIRNDTGFIYHDTINGDKMGSNKFEGYTMNDNLEFSFEGKEIDTNVNLNFLAINKAEENFESPYDGYVGLAPGGGNEYNLLDQLKDKGHIDHRIVAFYTEMHNQDSSIKFGSWDEQGLREGTRLRMIQTTDNESWEVSLTDVSLAQKEIELSNQATKALIEPQYPYIYIPESDFIIYKKKLEDAYPFQLACSNERKACFFNHDCDAVIRQDPAAARARATSPVKAVPSSS